MNILFFIPDKDPRSGGIFQYINCLLEILGSSEDENRYYLLLRDNTAYFLDYEKRFKNIKCIPEHESGANSTLLSWKEKIQKGISKVFQKINIQLNITTANSLDKVIGKYAIDVVHFPYIRWEKLNVPTITTIHDVQELYFPEYFSAEERTKRAVNNFKYITNANHIIVSYQHIKNDIVRFFQQPQEKIDVVLLNMQHLWFDKFLLNKEEYKKTVKEPYLLYPAVTWQHKNHLNLLKAILHLRETKNINVKLICTGKTTEYYTQTLHLFIVENRLDNNVSFVGIVDDENLFSLYQNAVGVVVPTKYEAGSFPLMESIMMQIPVICSNVTSLPETIGNEKYIFNPDDIQEMADKIELLFTSEEFRQQCVMDCQQQIKKLQHTNAYNKLMAIYAELGKNF
ncbi:MAG: glycosyltransferase family 1 protein [Chitinophagales bacterium]